MKKQDEVFGYPTYNQSEEAKNVRKRYLCPFMKSKCNKQSRTISYPMGVCSVNVGDKHIAICPQRFLENNIVFKDISSEIFGTNDNILLFSEVKIENVGSFDFVLVKHKPLSSAIDDFCVVEFQTDSTTGTGELVDAFKKFMEIREMKESYGFGMNTYNTIKLSYIQMLIKGQVFESWGKNIVWVLQDYVFHNMESRFNLVNLEYKPLNYNKFFIYDLEKHDDKYNIKLSKKKSTTVSNLLTAFTHQPTPDIKDFISHLEGKIKLHLGIKIK